MQNVINLNDWKNTLIDLPIINDFRVNLKEYDMIEKLSLVSDAVFKAIFINPKQHDSADIFISLAFGITLSYVQQYLVLNNNELPKKKSKGKSPRSDFVATIRDEDGVEFHIIIEINNKGDIHVFHRNLYYMMCVASSNIKPGEEYLLNNTILFNVNNFSFRGYDEAISKFQFNDKNGITHDNILTIFEVFIPNIRKMYYNGKKDELSDFASYVGFLASDNYKEATDMANGDENMLKLLEKFKEIKDRNDFKGIYGVEWDLAKEAESIGREEGISIGRDEGLTEGRNQNKLEVAKNMLKDKLDDVSILKYSGISEQDLNNLKKGTQSSN